MYLAQALGILKLTLIGMVLASINPFQSLGFPTPPVYHWMLQNKIYACVMVFFLSNTIEGQLISTGAFEIMFNDVPVWSKLETEKFPSPPELFQIIDNHILFRTSDASRFSL